MNTNRLGIIAVLFLLTTAGFAQINNGGSGGGGSGTVGNCAAAGNAYYSASGTTTSCDTSLTDNGAGALTSAQGTITTSTPVFSHTTTWNASGVAFTNWLSNITCTAAATASIAAGFGTAGTQWQFKYGAANCGSLQSLAPAGTDTLPSYGFSSAANEGMWDNGGTLQFRSPNNFNWSTAGTIQWQMLTAGHFKFSANKGQHIQTQAANNDLFGTVSGTTTTATVTFTTNYTSTPSCVITPTTAGVTSAIITSQANSGFTITYAPSGSTNFNYMCGGNPN